MSDGRITYKSRPFFMVECRDCGWELHSSNGMGTAARHSDAYKHTVLVEIERAVTFTYEKRGKADGRD